MARPSAYKNFVFTLNNFEPNDLELTKQFATEHCSYLIYGIETSTTGTPHLQGYFCLNGRKRIDTVKRTFSPRAHFESAKGTAQQNWIYCSKEGNFTEFGTKPADSKQGQRSDLIAFKEWIKNSPEYPSDALISDQWPSVFINYRTNALALRDLLRKPVALEDGDYGDNGNPWQITLRDRLMAEPEDDRQIDFYVDENGGVGKSWFVRKWMTDNNDAQLLGIGKRDDITYAIDITKRVFFFNVPRMQMQYLHYGCLESLKDRIFFSTKYQSVTKRMLHKPHVVVFSNEKPDFEKLTSDRYNIVEI